MSTTTLRVKTPPGFEIDGSPLAPDALAAMPLATLERFGLRAGGNTVAIGDLFDVSRSETGSNAGDPAPTLVIEGQCEWLLRIGAGMERGTLRVLGTAGDYAGAQMRGGTLEIEGDAGHFAACEMRGGRLSIAGNCGDFAAAARAGEMEGMTGGTLAIGGNAGERLADRMRRGLVTVGGNAGAFAASRLVAGTICVAGQVGEHYGYGMRRGTLVLAHAPAALPATFVAGGRGFDVFWALLVKSLSREASPFSRLAPDKLPRRYAGDVAVDGRGEILIVA
ncbi:formylmethanofuran dehydrogenase subunit C [Paraburkholderia sp. NMBU_R16]|uniref:formylmethanofuran dehydrogenase subunit C n=1 Tax=Paraburkholderia sp. NMBU_R16 TaxID=2698676 RepID=UPI0015666851|nr:formylmethanofuran dehydrogenase subunit C [Paraburkholderia sp. NMBU_R16]NRO94361.1 formylmethanofuran dehydrogenase subunit C [Paraburkholderia sp. NMBU_R16]